MTRGNAALDAARSIYWDAVLVGTGMGGATFGWALARAGWRVLFVEQGFDRGAQDSEAAVLGRYPELDPARSGAFLSEADAPLLRRAGRYADRMTDLSGARPHVSVPFVGAGVGGSSALYGMALERLFPSDFEPTRYHPAAAGAALVERWPIAFDELTPFYEEAEALYGVVGGRDPLRAGSVGALAAEAPSFTPPAARLVRHFEACGLHPYALPVACRFVAGCESCQGFLCARACKVDSVSACLNPARREFGALVLANCRVDRLTSAGRRVTAVHATCEGQAVELRGRVVVLAAGALRTPALLLRSADADWPQGLANGSGLVGRLLMRHLIDLYMVVPKDGAEGLDNRRKEFAFNDFYHVPEGKLGSVQSFGRLPPPAMIVGELHDEIRAGPLGWLHGVVPLGRPLLELALASMVDGSLGLATQVEDLPYFSNRVEPDPSGGPGAVQLHYRVAGEGRRRVDAMRKHMKAVLRSYRYRLLAQSENNRRIAHVCGTCRFGNDPRTSVLDRFNRAHELDNLYVVDASFFSASGGTNPSLTIAANALRVAKWLTS